MNGARIFIAAVAFALITWTPSAGQTQAAAFEQVSIIPMDRERVLTNQTVIVRDGRIAELGASGSFLSA